MSICAKPFADLSLPVPPSDYVPTGRLVIGSAEIEAGDPFSGWCAFCRLPNGDLFACWARSDNVTGDFSTSIYGSTSSDEGDTWSDPAAVLAAPTGGNSVCLPTGLCVLSDDETIALALVQGTQTYVMISTDNAVGWTDPAPVTFDFTGTLCESSSAPVQVGSTLYLAAYGDDTGSSQTYIRISASTDSGSTWADTGVALRPAAGRSYAEPWLCPLDNGTTMMTLRDQPTGDGLDDQELWSSLATSSLMDDWGPPALVPGFLNAGASPATVQTPQLDLWMLTRNVNGPAFSSLDRGDTWSGGTPLGGSNNYEYGQGAPLAGGLLGFVLGQSFDGGNHTSPYFYRLSEIQT